MYLLIEYISDHEKKTNEKVIQDTLETQTTSGAIRLSKSTYQRSSYIYKLYFSQRKHYQHTKVWTSAIPKYNSFYSLNPAYVTISCLTHIKPLQGSSYGPHLQIRAIVFSDEGAVTLAEDCDLLLDVFHFIFSLLQVNDLYSDLLLCVIVNAFKDLSKRSLPNPL